MNIEKCKGKKGGKKGGRGSKFILVGILLLISACGPVKVQIVPSDDNLSKVTQVVENQGLALQEIIKILQEKGIVQKPEEKK